MSSQGVLNKKLSQKTTLFGLKMWVLIGIVVGVFTVLMLLLLTLWFVVRKKWRPTSKKNPFAMIPDVSKEIKEVKIQQIIHSSDGVLLTITDSSAGESDAEKVLVQVGVSRKVPSDRGPGDTKGALRPRDGSAPQAQELVPLSGSSHASGDCCSAGSPNSSNALEFSHYGWGYWFTLRDLEIATQSFSQKNILGEGGYGIVYRGQLANGITIAVKNLLNNLGQAEREFTVEVEAIGRVRHKNLVRLLGYCMEGTYRMLVYEYVNNGNLEQWLHGPLGKANPLTWEARMKIVIGTAKALAYLHEAVEPKVVHRDVKASNILVDGDWNPKVSDFGLAKMLGSGKSHVTTRVMGTFGYVAPEYANTGLLNERSDVYSFGVLLLEIITGRDPVDYARPPGEVNLVDWLKVMVGSGRSEEVVDPTLPIKPSSRVLKRSLVVALRCVDPESEKRPAMGHVVPMLEAEDFPYRDQDRRVSKEANYTRKMEAETQEGMIRHLSDENVTAVEGGGGGGGGRSDGGGGETSSSSREGGGGDGGGGVGKKTTTSNKRSLATPIAQPREKTVASSPSRKQKKLPVKPWI